MEIAFSFNGGSMDARNFVWSEKKVFYYNEKDEKCSPDSAVWIRQMKCIDTVYDLWIGFDLYKNTGSVKRSKGVYVRGGKFSIRPILLLRITKPVILKVQAAIYMILKRI